MIPLRSALFISLLHLANLNADSTEYIETWAEQNSPVELIRDWIGQGDYLNPTFTSWIDDSQVSLIVEVGSRDAIDALDLSNYYKAPVYAFECNPQAIEICKYNINHNPNIRLVTNAAWNETTTLNFFPVIPGGSVVCIGASSLFPFDPNGPVKGTQHQGKISVSAIRLDEWMEKEKIPTIDLLCVDAQGATLQVVEGLGERISDVKYIICEAEFVPYYVGEKLYPEIESYLKSKGFTPVTHINFANLYADVLFVRNDILNK